MIHGITSNQRGLWLFLCAVAVAHLWFSIRYFRPVGFDDAYFASFAYEIFTDFFRVHAPINGEAAPLRISYLHTILYAPIMHIFDESMYAHRVISSVLACGVLYLWFLLFRQWSNTVIALQAVVLFALCGDFVRGAHSARPDMLVLALLTAGFFVQSYVGPKSKWLILAAFLSGMSVTAHPIGLLSCVLFAAYALLTMHSWKSEWKRYIAMSSAGYGLALFVFCLDNAPHLQLFLDGYGKTLHSVYQQTLEERFAIFLYIPKTAKTLYLFVQFQLPIIALILLIVWDRWHEKYIASSVPLQQSLLLFVILLISYLLLGRINVLYLILFTPLLWFGVAYLAHHYTRGGLSLIFAAGLLAIWVAVFMREGGVDPKPYTQQLKQKTAPYLNAETVVLGLPHHWYIFRNQPFFSFSTKQNLNQVAKRCNMIMILPKEYFHKQENTAISTDASLLGDIQRLHKTVFMDSQKIGEVFNEHYGTVQNNKNNTLEIYYRPAC